MQFKRTESRENERYIVFQMCDSSMSPEIKEGDEIQVDTLADLKDGDLVVAILEDGRTIFRKMKKQKDGEYIFTPFNNRYDPIFSKAPIIVGRAVRLYRKITGTPFESERESNIAGIIPCFDARSALDYDEREGAAND